MPKNAEKPSHALVVTNYQEFRELVSAHARGNYGLTAIIGPPGVAKSEIVNRTMQHEHGVGRWALISGKCSPLTLYQRLFEHRLNPLVLDDLDGLFADTSNTALLKAATDTRPVRRIQWSSYHRAFAGPNPLPRSFDSISRIALIANDWGTLNKNIGAVLDRANVICFRPSAMEIHREIATAGWFLDEEVFRFIGEQLHLLVAPSFRFYLTASKHKRAGLNWKDLVLRTIESSTEPAMLLVAKLLADPKFDRLPAPETAREKAFVTQGGGSRATFFRYKRELLESRGTLDQDEIAAIHLGPAKVDLSDVAMAERAEFLESLREPLGGPLEDEP